MRRWGGGERGRFELTPYNFKSTNAAATKITQNNLFIVAVIFRHYDVILLNLLADLKLPLFKVDISL